MTISMTPRYGAAELKDSYNRNLGFALMLSVGAHVVFFLLYTVFASGGGIQRVRPSGHGPITIAPPNPRQTDGGGGGAPATPPPSVASLLSVTADQLMADTNRDRLNLLPNPGTSLMPSDTGHGGTGLGGGRGPDIGPPDSGSGQPLNVTSTRERVRPDPEVFVPVEQEPTFDAEDLASRVKYPELARRSNVEGTVVLRVLVDEQGRAVEAIVDRCDAAILEPEARRAVLATPFTPALQNKQPIAVWVQVPVVFSLR